MTRMGHFADLMNRALKERGITKYRLEKLTGVAQGLLSRYGSGKAVPEEATITKIAGALEIDLTQALAAADADRLGADRAAAIQQVVSGGGKTRKPWPLHDLGQTSATTQAQQASVKPSNELSTSGEQSFGNDNQSGNLDIRTGDNGHIMPLDRDFGLVKRLPVFRVSCGEPVFINEAPEEWQAWPVVWVGDVDGIMLVEGTSMIGCGYRPGDQLFFQAINGRRPQHGDKVVAEVDGGAVCKLYQKTYEGEFLMSAPGEEVAFFRKVDASVRLVGIVKKRLTDG